MAGRTIALYTFLALLRVAPQVDAVVIDRARL